MYAYMYIDINIYSFCVCACDCVLVFVCMSLHMHTFVKARGQFGGISSLLPHLGFRESLNSGGRFVGKCLYPLSHLVYPLMVFNCSFVFVLLHFPATLSFPSGPGTPYDVSHVLRGSLGPYFLCCCLFFWYTVDLHSDW